MRTARLLLLPFLPLPLLPATAQAQQPASPPPAAKEAKEQSPISPERPGYTNGTDTVPPGDLQFEIGFVYSGFGGSHLSQLGNGAQLRVPLTERAEVRFGLPSYQWASASGQPTQTGFIDSGISAKVRLLDGIQKHRPSFAFIGGTTFANTGSTAFREKNAQPTADFETHYDLSDLWNVEMNYIYTRASSGGQRFDQRSGAVCLSYNVSPALGTFLETYRINPTSLGAPTGDFVDGGVTYVVGNNTQYDVSASKGVTRGLRSGFFVGAGYARRF